MSYRNSLRYRFAVSGAATIDGALIYSSNIAPILHPVTPSDCIASDVTYERGGNGERDDRERMGKWYREYHYFHREWLTFLEIIVVATRSHENSEMDGWRPSEQARARLSLSRGPA